MEFLKSAILGAGFGITEGFPISSGGHLLLLRHILEIDGNILILYPILCVGVLVSVLFLYRKLILDLVKAFFKIFLDIFKGEFNFKNCDRNQNILVAFLIGLIPTFLIFVSVPGSGTNVFGIVREFSYENNIILAGISFLINGILLKLGINNLKSDKFKYTYKASDNTTKRWDGRMRFTIMDAVWCGVMHFVSIVFPGISHIGAVFSIGIIRGINRKLALNYAFLLSIPLLVMTIISELSFVVSFNDFSNFNVFFVLIGIFCSLIFSLLFIKLFSKMVQKNKISIFAIYSILLGFGVTAIGILEKFYGINIFKGTVL